MPEDYSIYKCYCSFLLSSLEMIDQVLSQWQYVNFPLVSHQRLELYSQCPWAKQPGKAAGLSPR